MFRYLSVPLLAIGLLMFFTVQARAAEGSQPPTLKVYKDPG